MTRLFITLITFYQKFLSPLLHQLLGLKTACRYPISCSAYAKRVIAEYGILRGGALAVKRILSCQPFSQNYGHI